MNNVEPGNGQLRHRDTMVGLGEYATGEDAGPRGIFRTLKETHSRLDVFEHQSQARTQKKPRLSLKLCTG